MCRKKKSDDQFRTETNDQQKVIIQITVKKNNGLFLHPQNETN